jgi:hypothetical protein
MNALLQERNRRQKEKRSKGGSRSTVSKSIPVEEGDSDIKSLVERVKRKSQLADSGDTRGKRRKL